LAERPHDRHFYVSDSPRDRMDGKTKRAGWELAASLAFAAQTLYD